MLVACIGKVEILEQVCHLGFDCLRLDIVLILNEWIHVDLARFG